MYNIRYYYTLNEIFEGDFNMETLNVFLASYTNAQTVLDTKFAPVINNLNDNYHIWNIGFIDKLGKYFGEFPEPTNEEIDQIKYNFIKKFSVIYNFTSDRYLTLLGLYEANKRNLMSKLTNTSNNTTTHRVNDTPQNGGDFYDDEHTSVYEQTVINNSTSIDPTTVMSRLAEIERDYMNVIADWANEFKSLFMAPNNEW